MFNVFQLLRTVMGIVQLNAFVAWCKDAMACVRALSGNNGEDGGNDTDSSAEISEQSVEHASTIDEGDIGLPGYALMNDMDDDEVDDMEEEIVVNNTVIDNELGGREVTVLPSPKKMFDGLKKGSLAPSRWLQTDRVMLNTVRWCGVYLCGMGEHWSVQEFVTREGAEMLDKFFSEDMKNMLSILQYVEWNVDLAKGGRDFCSIRGLDAQGKAALTGEMSTAYGTGFGLYDVRSTYNAELYSFEFNSLVSSFPASDRKLESGNRESVKVGLAHSVVLAKHLGVEKLSRIRKYYDHYRVPLGSVLQNAFRLLREQMGTGIPDNSQLWELFESSPYKIPLFPYRMQAVALWDEATNWRVLQASAHQDIWNSLEAFHDCGLLGEEENMDNTPHRVNLFDHSAEWSKGRVGCKGSLGVVIETVRTFLAEWIAESGREPCWEPEVPKDCFEFNLGETSIRFDPWEKTVIKFPQHRLIWICQRELQGKVAKMRKGEENLPGNPALIFLFLLGLPLLCIEEVQDTEVGAQESQGNVQPGSATSSSNRHNSVDMDVHLWRTWSDLAPQDISLMLGVNLTKRTVSLRLQNDSDDVRFCWQDWVDSAMGYMKGTEEHDDGDWGYGRQILKADLHEPMIELCPLRVNEDGIEPEVEKTTNARVWMGWPAFDVRICKFELEQWLSACDLSLNGALEEEERWSTEYEVSRVEKVIKAIISEENEGMGEVTKDG